METFVVYKTDSFLLKYRTWIFRMCLFWGSFGSVFGRKHVILCVFSEANKKKRKDFIIQCCNSFGLMDRTSKRWIDFIGRGKTLNRDHGFLCFSGEKRHDGDLRKLLRTSPSADILAKRSLSVNRMYDRTVSLRFDFLIYKFSNLVLQNY